MMFKFISDNAASIDEMKNYLTKMNKKVKRKVFVFDDDFHSVISFIHTIRRFLNVVIEKSKNNLLKYAMSSIDHSSPDMVTFVFKGSRWYLCTEDVTIHVETDQIPLLRAFYILRFVHVYARISDSLPHCPPVDNVLHSRDILLQTLE